MTDHRIHIGQFNEIYYDAQEVFAVIEAVPKQTNPASHSHDKNSHRA